MKAHDKAMIDGLAKKAFESIIDEIPDECPASGRTMASERTAESGRVISHKRRIADPFPFIACAMALIMVIPPAIGKTRTTFADIATAACESGRFDGSAEFMTMVFARGGERIRQSRK